MNTLSNDELLDAIAEMLNDACPTQQDLFAVVMVNTEKDEANGLMERLRAAVEAYPFERQEVQPQGTLTISGGLAVFPGDASQAEQLLRPADEALYRSKADGRNRVTAAEPAVREP